MRRARTSPISRRRQRHWATDGRSGAGRAGAGPDPPRPKGDQGVRRPGRREGGRPRDPARGDHQPDRSERGGQDDLLQRHRGHPRPDRRRRPDLGPTDDRPARASLAGAGTLGGTIGRDRPPGRARLPHYEPAGGCRAGRRHRPLRARRDVPVRDHPAPRSTSACSIRRASSAVPSPTRWPTRGSAGRSRTSASSRT